MSALRLVTEEFEQTFGLEEGLARLERGGPRPGLCVDLGHGALARADGALGQAGLTQRLLGHRLLLALAQDPVNEALELPDRTVDISIPIKELLDLARPES